MCSNLSNAIKIREARIGVEGTALFVSVGLRAQLCCRFHGTKRKQRNFLDCYIVKEEAGQLHSCRV